MGNGVEQVYVLHHLEYMADHAFEDFTDLDFVQERSLAIDLGEFGLAVGAQVFVAEAR